MRPREPKPTEQKKTSKRTLENIVEWSNDKSNMDCNDGRTYKKLYNTI